MKKPIIILVILSMSGILIGLIINSCKHEVTDISKIKSICFDNDVLPIFQSNCTMSGCHNASSTEIDIHLDNYTNVMKVVVPKKPFKSRLYNAITNKWGQIMPPPPASPLTENQRSLVYLWILQGADSCSISYSAQIEPIISSSCRSCHSGTSAQADVHLEDYNGVKSIATDGRMVSVIYEQNGKPLMPPDSALDDSKKSLIKKWVNAGAPNN